MNHLGYTSLHKWCSILNSDRLLQYLVGSFDSLCVSNHYDFIERLTGEVHHLDKLFTKDYYKKPKDKPKKGEKLVNYSNQDTRYLLEKYKNGADDKDRKLYKIQSLFNTLAVNPSLDKGLIDKQEFVLSGDGSSLHIHASTFPKKVKEGNDSEEIYRVSAPDADIGWDSDLEAYYLGYTLYNISYHNKKYGIDLPVYLTLKKASVHDALTSIEAFAQLLDMNSKLHPDYICLDSASDSLAIYQYFRLNNIIPVIDHNKRHNNKAREKGGKEYINNDGIPVCRNSVTMCPNGYDYTRKRYKYRCPLVMGKIKECPFKEECSSSRYGRVIYVNDGDEAKYNGPLSYKDDKWIQIYKNRSSTERINNRILNDYKLHSMKCRDLAKNAFMSIIAGINIHLDAWIKLEA